MNFLYILSKQEFTSLYRFGHLPLRKGQIIETLNKSSKEIENQIFENFKSLAYFVGDEEYLMINIIEFNIESNLVDIENVSEIIPLTKASKSSLEMKFDNRIDFKQPRFENVFRRVEEYIDIQDCINGAKAFCKLSKVNNPFHKLIEDQVIMNAYEMRVNGGKSSTNTSFYTQLLIYERYEFFPKSDLGYFYDVGEAFAHSKEHPTFIGSGFYNFLEDNKKKYADKSFIEIANFISNAAEVKKFTDQLTINNIREYIVAALFQKFKTDLRERDSIIGSETGITIRDVKDDGQYKNELNFAIYLTGSFLGYKKFYDDLYGKSELKFFKNEKGHEKKEKVINVEETIEGTNETPIINIDLPKKDDLNVIILDKIKIILDRTSNGQAKVEKDILKEFQLILKPIFKSKKPTISDILNHIRKEYLNEFQILKKDIIRIKKEPELF